MNILILFIEILLTFSLLLICKKFLGKEGLIAWVGVVTVLANIITAKTIDIFCITTTLGTVLFASTFLATDILVENYSIKDAKKAIKIGLFANIILIISTQIALRYIPNSTDYANDAMQTLFSLNLRISLASMIMYYVANIADVYLFSKIKKKTNGTKLWLRNNISTILCNCIENFGFISLAFAGIYDIKTIVVIALSTSIIEIIVAICDTPFLYLGCKIKN